MGDLKAGEPFGLEAASVAKIDWELAVKRIIHPAGGANMFLPTRSCWNALQKALKAHASNSGLVYVVKADVANYFGSLNQHELINVLSDCGYPRPLYSRLEALLTGFTGNRSSRGILQGLYPSDLFGNFYMAPIDTLLEEHGCASARYVDDFYIFVRSMRAADRLLRELIPALRSYDLVLNEAKSKILPKSSLMAEEPDLEELFSNAVEEISSQINDDEFDVDYGFQTDWDDGEDENGNSDLKLAATKILFDSIEDYVGHEENIERFCLPLFATANSDYAIEHVKDAFKKRPAMSQIFVSYLAKFIETASVKDFLFDLLVDQSLMDWQRMWVLAGLSQAESAKDSQVKIAFDILREGDLHEALRAAAAVYVGRYGEHPRRKALVTLYGSVSPFIQSAIYFSSRTWPGVERGNAKASWGNQHPLNTLITFALGKR